MKEQLLYKGEAKQVADRMRGDAEIVRIEEWTRDMTILYLKDGRKIHIRYTGKFMDYPGNTWVEYFKSSIEFYNDPNKQETIESVRVTL